MPYGTVWYAVECRTITSSAICGVRPCRPIRSVHSGLSGPNDSDIDQLELVNYNRKTLRLSTDAPSIESFAAHPSHTWRSEVYLCIFSVTSRGKNHFSGRFLQVGFLNLRLGNMS